MEIISPSRRKQKVGDIFTFKVPAVDQYLFGRVIRIDIPLGDAPMPGCLLIYVYDVRSKSKAPVPDGLTPDRLLIAPAFINRQPWQKGYFETIENRPVESQDKLPVHCFHDPVKKQYVTDTQEVLKGCVEPCGSYGLHSYLTIDDEISKALGVPLSDD
ncbi:immunity 26/phosphotriesterase HocA family protein [Spirillospora albida]|uniref:immunity 26/phosphotriesterase HocA family protein n=1 Tax=Spirillospora albida TaxID=58123 RepID=UPI0024814EA4|nr:immunity 26/phosphotriesterase HocA family protein [Spirillospora albida]